MTKNIQDGPPVATDYIQTLLRAIRRARTTDELALPLEQLTKDLRSGRVSLRDGRTVSDAADRRFLKLRPRSLRNLP